MFGFLFGSKKKLAEASFGKITSADEVPQGAFLDEQSFWDYFKRQAHVLALERLREYVKFVQTFNPDEPVRFYLQGRFLTVLAGIQTRRLQVVYLGLSIIDVEIPGVEEGAYGQHFTSPLTTFSQKGVAK
jgi:hypothetical protein